jgi:hypothetical protein
MHSRFAQDDNHWSSDTASSFARNWVIPKRKQSTKSSRLSVIMQWGLRKLKSGSTALKMAAFQWTVTSIPGDRQRSER